MPPQGEDKQLPGGGAASCGDTQMRSEVRQVSPGLQPPPEVHAWPAAPASETAVPASEHGAQSAVPIERMRQIQVPPSQLHLNACVGPPLDLQAHGIWPRASQSAVPGAHAPYGRATSIMGAPPEGHADSPQATGQVWAASEVPLGSNSKCDVGPKSGEGVRHTAGPSSGSASGTARRLPDLLPPPHETTRARTTIRANDAISLCMAPMLPPRLSTPGIAQRLSGDQGHRLFPELQVKRITPSRSLVLSRRGRLARPFAMIREL